MAFFFVSVILSQSLQDVGTDAGGVLIAASLKTGRSRTQNLRPAAWNKGKERKKERKKGENEIGLLLYAGGSRVRAIITAP